MVGLYLQLGIAVMVDVLVSDLDTVAKLLVHLAVYHPDNNGLALVRACQVGTVL